MSNVAKNWALRQDLKPVPKLILLVLADIANDQGICWPSITTLAGKVGVTPRTVQRTIQRLVRRDLITVEQRYRGDGSCSSNRYRLSLDSGDNVSLSPDCGDTTPRHERRGPPVTSVTPGTTIGTKIEPPLPPMPQSDETDRGGGSCSDLVFPKNLLPDEQVQAEVMVSVLKAPINQQVLDEWAGIIAAGSIRSSLLGCVRALVKRAQHGTFVPERALRVAQARMAQQRMVTIQTAAPELAPIDENNALVRRLMAIRKRSSEK